MVDIIYKTKRVLLYSETVDFHDVRAWNDNAAKQLLKMYDLFINIDFKIAYGVLDYFGIESDKIFETYMQLISFDNFKDIQEKN